MALKEVPLNDGPEQLSFKAFELAEMVAELIHTEAEKKDVNEDFNHRIKALKKSVVRLSAEIEGQKKG